MVRLFRVSRLMISFAFAVIGQGYHAVSATARLLKRALQLCAEYARRALLPVLATYLGHVDIRSTRLYLHPTAVLLAAVNGGFHDHFRDTVNPPGDNAALSEHVMEREHVLRAITGKSTTLDGTACRAFVSREHLQSNKDAKLSIFRGNLRCVSDLEVV